MTFPLSRASIFQIIELMTNYLNFTELALLALQFFASGRYQIIRGDGINVNQASASRYIRDVSLDLQAI